MNFFIHNAPFTYNGDVHKNDFLDMWANSTKLKNTIFIY